MSEINLTAGDPQFDKYIENEAQTCIKCGSKNIDAGEIELDLAYGWLNVYCIECEHKWTDEYKVTSSYWEEEVAKQNKVCNFCTDGTCERCRA